MSCCNRISLSLKRQKCWMNISCCVFKSCYMCVWRCLPGLRSVAVQDLVGSDQVQFPMALLKHVDPRQPTGRGDQSLLHGGWIHQLPVQDGARGQRRTAFVSFVCWYQVVLPMIQSNAGGKKREGLEFICVWFPREEADLAVVSKGGVMFNPATWAH